MRRDFPESWWDLWLPRGGLRLSVVDLFQLRVPDGLRILPETPGFLPEGTGSAPETSSLSPEMTRF